MSFNVIEMDKEILLDCLSSENYAKLSSHLQENFKLSQACKFKEHHPFSVNAIAVCDLIIILKTVREKLENATVIELVKEVFRSLRNCIAVNSEIQNVIGKDTQTFEFVRSILETLLNSNNHVECSNMLLQFLINIVVKNSHNGSQVWNEFKPLIYRTFKNPEYLYYASALLYNIVLLNDTLLKECSEIYSTVIENVSKNEYCTFTAELLAQDVCFMSSYETLESSKKIIILSILTDLIRKDHIINDKVVQILTLRFKNEADCILKTITEPVETVEPQEVVLLLEIISSLSGKDCYRSSLQEDGDLVATCSFLLRSVQAAGKGSENHFTPLQKLSEVGKAESEENPVFGFKAALIQFLGNVCWKHKENQDKLREMECIPLLLDCCNIDARNPFITQWSILAIRNLCEENPQNQSVIAGMTRKGVVSSTTLLEMGLTLHDDDGLNKIVMGALPGY